MTEERRLAPPAAPSKDTKMPHHMGYAMTLMGFCGDPRKWVGKTIADVEILKMEYGAVSDSAVLFRFEDGSRGWSVGRGTATGIITGPQLSDIATSRIITADEYGQLNAAKKRLADQQADERRGDKERQLAQLQRELGVAS